MEAGTEISQISNTNLLQKVQTGTVKTSVVQPKTAPIPNDTIEISSKKQDGQSSFGKVAAMLGILAVVAGGGTFGGVRIFDKYFNKLSSGIKKGEIHDALFQFIKNNDPKGRMFNNKEKILQINEKLTDDNLLILKRLTKMQDENSKRWGWMRERFTLDDMTELMTGANEFNIKYLEQLAKKSETKYNYTNTYKTNDILDILKNITPDNDKVAAQLIDIADINNPEELVTCLSKIKKENVDIYQLLLSTRKKGANTELSLNDLQKIADVLKETKNPKCAELFLNQEKNDGSGLFRYNMEDIENLLKVSDDEKVETYKKLFDLNCTKDVESGMVNLIKSVSDDNIDLIEPLITKRGTGYMSKYVIFDNWYGIEGILKSVNKDNKDVAARIIDIVDESRIHRTEPTWKTIYLTDYLPEFFGEISKSPASKKIANEILDKGIVDGKQTLGIQDFYTRYNDAIHKSASPDNFLS